MSEENKVLLKKLILQFANSSEPNPVSIKKIKNICKKEEENVTMAFESIFKFLEKPHCSIRYNCLILLDALFTKSHNFRKLLLDKFEKYIDLTLGLDPKHPLPPPTSQHKKLIQESIKKIKEWKSTYGPAYKKLENSYESLKESVDFDNLCLIDHEARNRRIERDARLEEMWSSRIQRIKSEFEELEPEISSWITAATNLQTLSRSKEQEYKDELQDQCKTLSRRLLPKVLAWLDSLTRAGDRTDHQLLRHLVDIKNQLSEKKSHFEKLGIDNFCIQSTSSKESKSKKLSTPYHEDPTSMHANYYLETGDHEIDTNINIELVDSGLERSPTRAKSKTDIPKVKLENLIEPDRIIVDPEKSRFWVSDHREGQEIFVGNTQTISEFVGDVEPVKWSCRVKLPSGELCPRMDRQKCPLHGVIVARNEDGSLAEASTNLPTTSGVKHEKKKTRKTSRLKAAKAIDETSRSRISKKIFNRSTAKRVAKDLKNYDKIKTKNRFTDQFNY